MPEAYRAYGSLSIAPDIAVGVLHAADAGAVFLGSAPEGASAKKVFWSAYPPEAVLPLLRRDSYESFANKVYTSAMRAANTPQKAHLKAAVARHHIKIKAQSLNKGRGF